MTRAEIMLREFIFRRSGWQPWKSRLAAQSSSRVRIKRAAGEDETGEWGGLGRLRARAIGPFEPGGGLRCKQQCGQVPNLQATYFFRQIDREATGLAEGWPAGSYAYGLPR